MGCKFLLLYNYYIVYNNLLAFASLAGNEYTSTAFVLFKGEDTARFVAVGRYAICGNTHIPAHWSSHGITRKKHYSYHPGIYLESMTHQEGTTLPYFDLQCSN